MTITSLEIPFTHLSQFEMTWGEMAPGFLMLILLGAGFYHRQLKKRLKRRHAYKYKQRDERKRLSLPLIINTPVTQEFSISTFDISTSGAFLPYEDLRKSMSFTSLIGKRSGIKVGDLIDVRVYTGRFSQFQCQAKVVRYNFPPSQQTGALGIGIEFMNLSQRKRKALKALIEKESIEMTAAS